MSWQKQHADYTILKCHTIDGNRDVYFGTPEMTINDVKQISKINIADMNFQDNVKNLHRKYVN